MWRAIGCACVQRRNFQGYNESRIIPVEDFDNLFATNVRSPVFSRTATPAVLGEGSNIIVISSMARTPCLGSPVWRTLRFLPTPRPKEH